MRCRAAGADEIVDMSMPDLRESLRARIFELTGGKGADIILDPLGGDFFDAAVRALAWSGRLVVIGFASGRIPEIKANYILVKNIEITGLQISDYRKRQPHRVAECFAEIFHLYETGQVKPAPAITLPLEGFAEALGQIRDRTAKGRLVLTQGADRVQYRRRRVTSSRRHSAPAGRADSARRPGPSARCATSPSPCARAARGLPVPR